MVDSIAVNTPRQLHLTHIGQIGISPGGAQVPTRAPELANTDMKAWKTVTAAVLMGVLVGCAGVRSPSAVATPHTVPITQLSKQGFRFGAYQPAVSAAPSLIDLLGLLHGVGVFPSLEECNRFPYLRPACWMDIKDPANSLMVAAFVDVPCMLTDSVTAAMSATTELTITVMSSGRCIKPATQSLPYLTLLAVPLSAVPAEEITVRVVHSGVRLPTARTMVDLRQPLNTSTDLHGRIAEVLGALDAATNDGVKRVPPGQSLSFVAIWTSRWKDTGLGCPVHGQQVRAASTPGYVVLMKGSDQPLLAMEFHVSGPALAFCGRVPYQTS